PAEEPPPTKKAKTIPKLEPPPKIERNDTPKPDISVSSPSVNSIKEANPKVKSLLLTPKKDVKSIAMQRVASTDTTTEVQTPKSISYLAPDRTATPVVPTNKDNQSQSKVSPAPSSTPRNGVSNEDHTAWQELQSRVFQLGRTLKKEAASLTANLKVNDTPPATCVLLFIEGLLCFMLNAAATAQSRSDPQWTTLIPYLKMLMTRLSKEPLHDQDTTPSAPTPGSDGATRTSDDMLRVRKSFARLRDELVKNSLDLGKAWKDGTKALNSSVIEGHYPKTWKDKSTNWTARNDKPNIKALFKYYLPVNNTSSVFEAVAFAKALLEEWSTTERVDWEARMKL
ncbi:hypothetical protein LTR66_015175, partial [Elasticomyces elasticus]